MKPLKFLLAALFCGVLFTSPAPTAQAQAPAAADEVNLDFFYSNLKDQGDWLETPEYGYVFNPRVQRDKTDWRPYSDGYWAHSDEGWLWNSYEDFGWATYHYGRWTRLKDYGWVWVPGYEWAPAWVAWRGTPEEGTDGGAPVASSGQKSSVKVNYVGWAPLPPEAQFDSAVGFNSAVDYRYDIAPDDYCFVPTQSFGAPYLAAAIIAPLAAYAFWSSTYGYTNIAYTNYGWGRGVYVGGPRYGWVNAYAPRPIPYYQVQRNFAYANGGANNFRPGRPVNGVMPVFAPRVTQVNKTSAVVLKPAVVKATVPPGQVQRGWNATKANPAEVAKAKEHLKTQSTGAAPAFAPTAAQRVAPQNVPRAGMPAGLPAGAAALPAAGMNPGAVTPNAGMVPKNQLSPQNAAAIQAGKAAQGVPPTMPNAGATPKNQLNRQNAAAINAGQPATGVPTKTNRNARSLVEKPTSPPSAKMPTTRNVNPSANSAAAVKKAPANVTRKAPTSTVQRQPQSVNRSVQPKARNTASAPKVKAAQAPKVKAAPAPKKAPAAKPAPEKKKKPPGT